jgi:CspA family cold shock protein
MPLFYRLLLCFVIALPASGVYHAWTTTDSFGFIFKNSSALAFSITALLTMSLTHLQSNPFASLTLPKRKRSRKAAAGREMGSVKWFSGSKGFGFITRDNGDEIFVHFRSLQKDSKRLSPGLDVEYAVVDGDKGPEAADVKVV